MSPYFPARLEHNVLPGLLTQPASWLYLGLSTVCTPKHSTLFSRSAEGQIRDLQAPMVGESVSLMSTNL